MFACSSSFQHCIEMSLSSHRSVLSFKGSSRQEDIRKNCLSVFPPSHNHYRTSTTITFSLQFITNYTSYSNNPNMDDCLKFSLEGDLPLPSPDIPIDYSDLCFYYFNSLIYYYLYFCYYWMGCCGFLGL